jgi:hypothetical protein
MPHVFNGFIDVSSTLDAWALFFARLLLGSQKGLGDTLQGMVRAGILKSGKHGKETKYTIA